MAIKKRQNTTAARHLAKSILLEETGSPAIIRFVIVFISFIVTAFIVWSIYATVDEVAVAEGEIVPVGHVKKVQHLNGGIIEAIFIKEGDLVETGQLLIQLDSTLPKSQLKQSLSQQEAMLVQKERIKSFIDGNKLNFNKKEKQNTVFVEDQQRIYEHLERYLDTRRSILKEMIDQKKIELNELDAQEKMMADQKKLLEEELSIRKKLSSSKLHPITEVLSIQRQLSKLNSDIDQIPTGRKKINEKLKELSYQLFEVELNIKEKPLMELSKINEELSQLQEVINRNKEIIRMSNISAPASGYVHDLKPYTIGEVITSGSTLLCIVPANRKLLAEVKISSRDIGHIKIGVPVKLKFTTYDFGRYGGLNETLNDISASTFLDKNGSPYYKGTVSLTKIYLLSDPKSHPILPGMTLTADIKTGSKKVIEYLLKPIFTSAKKAFRER
ncbi:MAG: HlyD family type I secretion periplasmic adaptor subunit [Desulfobacterales bacterium]|nr:HlyD family type I secretion periplasmic adaptor subunit [Desulfobacterales bacterium]